MGKPGPLRCQCEQGQGLCPGHEPGHPSLTWSWNCEHDLQQRCGDSPGIIFKKWRKKHTVRSGQPVESCASGMPQTLQSSSSSIANSTQKCWNKHYIRYIHKLYIYICIYICVYIYIVTGIVYMLLCQTLSVCHDWSWDSPGIITGIVHMLLCQCATIGAETALA